jgi:hypothetical protein
MQPAQDSFKNVAWTAAGCTILALWPSAIAGRVRARFLNSAACNQMASRDRPSDQTPSCAIAHAGSSGPVDPAGSPACRGWRSDKVKADRTAEEVEYHKTNPIQANLDCHKPYCGIALNSFGASVGAKNEANDRGCFLQAAGCLQRDRPEGSRETNGSRARQQANANQRKQSHRITTHLHSSSPPAMT